MINLKGCLIILLFMSVPVESAINLNQEFDSVVLNSLSKSKNHRLKLLKEMDFKTGLASLERISTSKKYSFNTRWRAVTTAAKAYPKESVHFLQKVIQRPEWYSRNSALLGLWLADKTLANKWALKLIKDKSLIVRTAAVKIIGESDTSKERSIHALKTALTDQANFRKTKSLWIRHHIVTALSKRVHKRESFIFYNALTDTDKRVRKSALAALDKLHPKVANRMNKLSTKQKIVQWKKLSKGRNIF